MDDRGARDDEDGGTRQRPGERFRNEQRAVDVPEAEGVVRVEKNFGTDHRGRLHCHLDGGDRRHAVRDLCAFVDHRGTHCRDGFPIPGAIRSVPAPYGIVSIPDYIRVCEYQDT